MAGYHNTYNKQNPYPKAPCRYCLEAFRPNLGCSQNHVPLLVADYIMAPNIQGYQDRTHHVSVIYRRRALELC